MWNIFTAVAKQSCGFILKNHYHIIRLIPSEIATILRVTAIIHEHFLPQLLQRDITCISRRYLNNMTSIIDVKKDEGQCKDRSNNQNSELNPATDGTMSEMQTNELQEVLESEESSLNRKRTHEGEADIQADLKKVKTMPSQEELAPSSRPPYKKKKVAMFLVYSGKGYLGMQKNPGVHTIEDDLLEAYVKSGIVTEDHARDPGRKMDFQRAARTDKGVSAAGQCVSLKMFIDVEDAVIKLNSHLPPQIRILGFKRTTKGFDSKNSCCYRTYQYLLPTFAFTPVEEHTIESYRMSDEVLQKVNEVLQLYKGTINFHNFTSGKKPDDRSAFRYIMEFKCDTPFVRQNMEFAVITVRGQSFMLHQIRKMIGLMIAIVRGLANKEAIERAKQPEKADIPIAPALGLYLAKTHYDHYNKKYGTDGMHEAVDLDEYMEEVEKFKEKYIYSEIIEAEKNEKSMLNWLATLPKHHFGERRPGELAEHLRRAEENIKRLDEESKNPEQTIKVTSSQAEYDLNEGAISKASNTQEPVTSEYLKEDPTEDDKR